MSLLARLGKRDYPIRVPLINLSPTIVCNEFIEINELTPNNDPVDGDDSGE